MSAPTLEEQLQAELKQRGEEDPFDQGDWLSFFGPDTIQLDGTFSLGQLEAMVSVMKRNSQEEKGDGDRHQQTPEAAT